MIYLYPDLKTAIIGKVDSKELTIIKGKDANVSLSFHKNNDSESTLKLNIYSNKQNNIYANENTQSLLIGQNDTIDLLLIEISNEVLTNEEPFTYFDAPNSKCIRFVLIRGCVWEIVMKLYKNQVAVIFFLFSVNIHCPKMR